MQLTDLENFAELLISTLELYDKKCSSMTIQIWQNALNKYDLSVIMCAFEKYVSNTDNGQFAPKPADIIKFIDGSSQDRALQAWSKVNKAVRLIGPYQSVVFDDQIIHKAIRDMGGWIELCNKSEDEFPFVAKEFEARYRGHISRDNGDYPSKLIGIAEHANSENGQKIAEPLLIGNQETASKIYLNGGENKSIETGTIGGLKLKMINKD